jgi:hypothetical protein
MLGFFQFFLVFVAPPERPGVNPAAFEFTATKFLSQRKIIFILKTRKAIMYIVAL